jgi:hypothetical protein
MASAAQVAANRENAKRSRTLSEETKESLRTRALKHGLASKLDANTVVRHENKEEFETILNALVSEATLVPEEILLINLQAQSYWKLQRAMKMETGALNVSVIVAQMENKVAQTLKDGAGLGSALAIALREHTAWFETLRRYSTTAERTFFKATRELAMIRKTGPQEPISQPEIAQIQIGQQEIAQPEIGYVPQNANPAETNEETNEETKEEAKQQTNEAAKEAAKEAAEEEIPAQPAEIGCDPQPDEPFLHPGAQPRSDLGGLSLFEFRDKLENMSQTEAFAFFDQLSNPAA